MNGIEANAARLAWSIVQNNGGRLSFEDFSRLMYPKRYWTQLLWPTDKASRDVLAARLACTAGRLKITEDGNGYEVVQ